MLQLSIREFNKNISKSFKTLPVEITNRGVVVALISAPNGVPMPAPAKFVKINKEDLKGGIKVDMKKAKEKAVAIPLVIPEGTEKGFTITPKNAGGRSSDTPSDSATPPPKTAGAFPGVLPPPTAGYPLTEDPNKILKIPLLRKTLCPKHSVFSCGCPEKEKRAR